MAEFQTISKDERRRIFRAAFVASVPVLLGYVTMGLAAGVLMGVTDGVPCAPFWSGFLGLAAVSGTLSFVMPAQIAATASYAAIALLTLGLNFRYALYGFSMLKKWQGIPLGQKYFLIHSLADEIYALDVACPETDPLKNRYYCLWNHAFNVFYWVFGTTMGGVVGATLPIPTKGIEFTMAALFLVIFTDQLRGFLRK